MCKHTSPNTVLQAHFSKYTSPSTLLQTHFPPFSVLNEVLCRLTAAHCNMCWKNGPYISGHWRGFWVESQRATHSNLLRYKVGAFRTKFTDICWLTLLLCFDGLCLITSAVCKCNWIEFKAFTVIVFAYNEIWICTFLFLTPLTSALLAALCVGLVLVDWHVEKESKRWKTV